MAKKSAAKSASQVAVKLSNKDKKTLGSLRQKLAGEVARFAERSRAPHLEVPSRSLSNVRFNQSKKIIEMGSSTSTRELFNLSQAKAYMQTLLVGSGCRQLIDQGKTTSIRGLFYLLKHTIEGTSEETFSDQDECDPIIEDVEVMLDALREELHVYASNVGNLAGPLTLLDNGDTIDCTRMGSAGYSIPSIVEPDVIEFVKCDAKFILHVEKDTVWRRFHEDSWDCQSTVSSIMTPGGTTSTACSSKARSIWPMNRRGWQFRRPAFWVCVAATMSAVNSRPASRSSSTNRTSSGRARSRSIRGSLRRNRGRKSWISC
jgi:DNA topoisomerase-6 subunit A